jgi:hypothetical protein
MKLPVVSGSEAVKAFRKLGTNSMSSTGATLFSDMPTRPTDDYPFPTIRNSPEELFGR